TASAGSGSAPHRRRRGLRRGRDQEAVLSARPSCRLRTRPRRSRPRAGRSRAPASRRAGLVQLSVDRAGCLRRNARHALELLLARGEEALRRAEVAKQCPPSRRPDPLELVEDRLPSASAAPLPVVAEGEPVRLVPEPLQKLEAGRVPLEDEGTRL